MSKCVHNLDWDSCPNCNQGGAAFSGKRQRSGSVPTWIKIKLRKAIHYIHNEGDYEKGMDVIAELAGIEVNETGAVQTTVSKLLEQNDSAQPPGA